MLALKGILFPLASFSFSTIRGFVRLESVIGLSSVFLISSVNVSSITAFEGTLMSPLRGLNVISGVIISFAVKEIELAIFGLPELSSTVCSIAA